MTRESTEQNDRNYLRDQDDPLDLLGIVDLVGGADNVLRLTRCWSRLRLVLVDAQDAQLGAIERLESVVDVAHRSGELQVTLSSGLGEAFELLSQRLPAATRS